MPRAIRPPGSCRGLEPVRSGRSPLDEHADLDRGVPVEVDDDVLAERRRATGVERAGGEGSAAQRLPHLVEAAVGSSPTALATWSRRGSPRSAVLAPRRPRTRRLSPSRRAPTSTSCIPLRASCRSSRRRRRRPRGSGPSRCSPASAATPRSGQVSALPELAAAERLRAVHELLDDGDADRRLRTPILHRAGVEHGRSVVRQAWPLTRSVSSTPGMRNSRPMPEPLHDVA